MPASNRPLRFGLVVGAIAYVIVAAFYALFDLLTARGVFHTVDQLGRTMLRGLGDTTGLETTATVSVAVVVFYNVIHLVAALLIGVVVTSLVEHAHRRPDRAPTILLVIISGFVVTIGLVGVSTITVREVLPWWSIIGANALAVASAGLFLIRRYPTAFKRLTNQNG